MCRSCACACADYIGYSGTALLASCTAACESTWNGLRQYHMGHMLQLQVPRQLININLDVAV
jgi:hypothetical protein